MTLTPYQANYLAHSLTRRFPPGSNERLAGAVANAQVDLNPHQVDAALFAFRSPLAKGALLADEVGLGKTIEAGLVLSQKWAEGSHKVLVITPSNLRKQWFQELSEKFFLPCRILESKSYNALRKQGVAQPFAGHEIVICSYEFARSKAADVRQQPWDVVVIDEAHRLRNVYKPTNVTANTLKTALAGRYKLLLTATPLQNSLLELYGLVSFIDEHTFGDLKSFREQFTNLNQAQVFQTLKTRLKPLCHRTLRRQVTAYIPYTNRLPLVEEFTPQESEDRLYELVSEYLRRTDLQALPASQRTLITLVLRKLLASSTFAIAGALTSLSNRLKAKLTHHTHDAALETELDAEYEAFDETAEEWPAEAMPPDLSDADRQTIEREIADLDAFAELATSIQFNAKGTALLQALQVAFAKARELGAAEKAIIFTESRRTQEYLLRLLADSPFAEGIVLFNGSNTDPGSKQIYQAWAEQHKGTDRITSSRTADMRSALVDYFREQGRIMIATEAGAEGINLQFCSLVVNYDLPWNPQRIEQRIGRCHRYGQKHDVVVVNFLNRKNAADQRVFELLSEKFKLFEGVFGTSDEVLGAIESGVDFEKRISDIYQTCRKQDEIGAAFDQLQRELSVEISASMLRTRQQLLENFDDEVREKLKVRDQEAKAALTRYEHLLMRLTAYELAEYATFSGDAQFALSKQPFPEQAAEIPLGVYELPRRNRDTYLYRQSHPLAERLIARAKSRHLPPMCVSFDYTNHPGKVSTLEPLVGGSGWLALSLFSVATFEQVEDYLIFAAVLDDGQPLDAEVAERLLSIGATSAPLTPGETPSHHAALLDAATAARHGQIQHSVSERNALFFEREAEKLDGWADDLKLGLEREIKELDRQIKEARRAATLALTLEEKLGGQKQVKALEAQRNQKRRSLFDAQDQVDTQREALIAEIEQNMTQKPMMQPLFVIRWVVR